MLDAAGVHEAWLHRGGANNPDTDGAFEYGLFAFNSGLVTSDREGDNDGTFQYCWHDFPQAISAKLAERALEARSKLTDHDIGKSLSRPASGARSPGCLALAHAKTFSSGPAPGRRSLYGIRPGLTTSDLLPLLVHYRVWFEAYPVRTDVDVECVRVFRQPAYAPWQDRSADREMSNRCDLLTAGWLCVDPDSGSLVCVDFSSAALRVIHELWVPFWASPMSSTFLSKYNAANRLLDSPFAVQASQDRAITDVPARRGSCPQSFPNQSFQEKLDGGAEAGEFGRSWVRQSHVRPAPKKEARETQSPEWKECDALCVAATYLEQQGSDSLTLASYAPIEIQDSLRAAREKRADEEEAAVRKLSTAQTMAKLAAKTAPPAKRSVSGSAVRGVGGNADSSTEAEFARAGPSNVEPRREPTALEQQLVGAGLSRPAAVQPAPFPLLEAGSLVSPSKESGSGAALQAGLGGAAAAKPASAPRRGFSWKLFCLPEAKGQQVWVEMPDDPDTPQGL